MAKLPWDTDPDAPAAAPIGSPGPALAAPGGGVAAPSAGRLPWDTDPDATAPNLVPGGVLAPPQAESWSERAVQPAIGANEMLANVAGMPADVSNWIANQGRRAVSAGAGALGYDVDLPPVSRPPGGSERIRDWMYSPSYAAPKDELDRVLQGAGGAAMALPLGAGFGAALAPAAEAIDPLLSALPGVGSYAERVAPGFTEALQAPLAAPVRSTAGFAASGAGSEMGRNYARAQGGGPLLQELGGLAGGMAGGFLPSTVEGMVSGVRGDVAPIAGRRLAEEQESYASRRNPAVYLEAGDIAMPGVGQTGSPQPYQWAQTGANEMHLIEGEAAQGERQAWRAVDPTGTATVSLPALSGAYDDLMRPISEGGTMSASRAAKMPNTIPDWFDQMENTYGDRVPFGEVKAFRTTLRGEIGMAERAGDTDKMALLTDLKNRLYRGLPEESEEAVPRPPDLDPTTAAAYDNASRVSQDYNNRYQTGKIRLLFRDDATGAPRLPDSATFSTLLGPQSGQAERVQAFLNATDGYEGQMATPRNSQGTPTGAPPVQVTPRQSARNWFIGDSLDRAALPGQTDVSGNPLISGQRLQSVFDANHALINSDLFSDADRATMGRMVSTASEAEQRAAAGVREPGSAYQEALRDPMRAAEVPGLVRSLVPYAGGVLGEQIGEHVGHPTLGLLLGAGAGGREGVGERALNWLYGNRASRLQDVLATAATNPDYRSSLIRRAGLNEVTGLPLDPQAASRSALASRLAGSGYLSGWLGP